MTTRLRRLIVAVALLAVGAQPAAANDVADFYKGKTITIAVGHEVGTGFDIYARALQRHLRRHIPGNPGIVVQNMSGAGGLVAANWLYNLAPKDGTAISSFVYSVPFEPLFGNNAARFEPAKFIWIGSMEEGIAVCGVSKAAGIGSFEDMRTAEAIFGAASGNGALARSAVAVRNLFGVRMKVVTGYKGTASIRLAIGRGEVHGVCSLLMSTIASAWREDYEAGNFRPIIQLSGRKGAGPKGVPHVDDFAKSDDDRHVHALVFGVQALGKLYAAPPGVPAARAAALRAALAATMKDPDFIADAARTQIDISPMTGNEVEAFITRVSAASPAVIERAKRAFAP
jgi:tripartite-type tricarboxylate transporter receptor subunit TctC